MRCDYSYSHCVSATTINRPQKGTQIILTQMSDLVIYDDYIAIMQKDTLPACQACHAGPRLAKGRSPTRLASDRIKLINDKRKWVLENRDFAIMNSRS